jgi:Zn-dependent peptidase ImmA (M78 family)
LALRRRGTGDIHRIAAELLFKYGFEECAPVEIEEMAEFDLGLMLVPRVGLHAEKGIHGAVSYDLSTIYIEHSIWTKERAWRLAVAHEVAHIILHGDFIRSLKGTDEDSLKAEVTGISATDNDVLEHEAEDFVDAIMVPEESLKRFHREELAKLEALDRSISELSPSSRQAIAGRMARSLDVPTAMVERRLELLGFQGWEPQADADVRLLPGFGRND